MEKNGPAVMATRKKTFLISAIGIALVLASIFYLWNVFIAQFALQNTVWDNPWDTSRSLGCNVTSYSMAAQGKKPTVEGYREDANVWLFQSHPTAMYTSEILADPKCLGAMLADFTIMKEDLVILIYDLNQKRVIFRIQKY